jgi:hypothetical protein
MIAKTGRRRPVQTLKQWHEASHRPCDGACTQRTGVLEKPSKDVTRTYRLATDIERSRTRSMAIARTPGAATRDKSRGVSAGHEMTHRH